MLSPAAERMRLSPHRRITSPRPTHSSDAPSRGARGGRWPLKMRPSQRSKANVLSPDVRSASTHYGSSSSSGDRSPDTSGTGRERKVNAFLKWLNSDQATQKPGYVSSKEAEYLGFVSAKSGHLGDLARALDAGVSVDMRDASDWTMLMWCAHGGRARAANFLLKRGAAPDACGGDGATPLILAAHQGSAEVTKQLLHFGSCPNTPNASTCSPLIAACDRGHFETARALLQAGADPNQTATPGWAAAGALAPHVLEVAQESLPGAHCETALQCAARGGYAGIVSLLLRYGASANAADGAGHTSVAMAAFEEHDEALRCLLEKGAHVDSVDKCGKTALMWACRMGHHTIAKLLISYGADVNFRRKGCCSLDWAILYSDDEMTSLLKDAGADSSPSWWEFLWCGYA